MDYQLIIYLLRITICYLISSQNQVLNMKFDTDSNSLIISVTILVYSTKLT